MTDITLEEVQAMEPGTRISLKPLFPNLDSQSMVELEFDHRTKDGKKHYFDMYTYENIYLMSVKLTWDKKGKLEVQESK